MKSAYIKLKNIYPPIIGLFEGNKIIIAKFEPSKTMLNVNQTTLPI